jgi:2-oxoglutarate ferredoxin oxidoreductase subunit beta
MPIELHDGSRLLLRKISDDYNTHNRGAAIDYIRAHQRRGEFVTGLLYVDASEPDLHSINETTLEPLNRLPFERLCPGRDALVELQAPFR